MGGGVGWRCGVAVLLLTVKFGSIAPAGSHHAPQGGLTTPARSYHAPEGGGVYPSPITSCPTGG